MDFTQALSGVAVLKNEPMARHTTFRVGGPADWLVLPKDENEVVRALQAAREAHLPVTVIGNGSNLIVRDGGLRGLVIKIARNMAEISRRENMLLAQAGASLRTIANQAREWGLGGLEFAAGIPGNAGGGACMNAGAYGFEMGQVIHQVRAVTRQGDVVTVPAGELAFGYRQSKIRDEGWILTLVEYALTPGDPAEILRLMREYDEKRAASQPLEFPSAGSVFKRPPGHYAGKLVQESGLKGFSIGGAQVSPKHAGFIVNTGNATADDVEKLIAHIQKSVWEQWGVALHTEVRIIGEGA